MRFVMYQDCVSPHQLPLARELVKLLGADNFRYVYRDADLGDRVGLGWAADGDESWMVWMGDKNDEWKSWVEESDVLYTGFREIDLFERRAKKGLRTFYTSERWLKPAGVFSGAFRLLVPSYRRMAKRFVKWANEDEGARVLAVGPWAKKDFLRMGVRAEKIVDWGYFVEKGSGKREEGREGQSRGSSLKILWAGRDIPLKRVLTTVGEDLADQRGLKGQERERFIYDLVNEYAFDTSDLPRYLAYLRGQYPTQMSSTLGAISRATVPFFGYTSRILKQMITDPVKKGIIPLAKRAFGKGEGSIYDEMANTSRPFMIGILISNNIAS